MERVYNVERGGMLVPTPKPTISKEHLFIRLKGFSRKLLVGWTPTARLSYDDTVKLWTGSKRVLYQRAAEEILRAPVVESDAELSTFVKAEKLNLSAKVDPAPRVIQPRNPKYNLELAGYLKNAEHSIFRQIDRVFDVDGLGDRTIFKGIDSVESARHMHLKASRYTNPVFIGLDASRFDQHCSTEILQWEHSILIAMCGGDKAQLARLLRWQLSNKGVAYTPEGVIRYTVDGCRMSGDMNTSLGNCLIMCALVYSYCTKVGLRKFSLANNGDDCVLIVERAHMSRIYKTLPTYFTEMGFTMKVEAPVFDVECVEFCQTKCVTLDNRRQMVRSPTTTLSKDTYSVKSLTHRSRCDAWLNAVGVGGTESHYGVPIHSAFYATFPRSSARLDDELAEELARRRTYSIGATGVESCPITPEARYSYWLAFGVTPDAQIAVEAELNTISLSAEVVVNDSHGCLIDQLATA
jgi:hypothetical protein